jgi:hypothetical protein
MAVTARARTLVAAAVLAALLISVLVWFRASGDPRSKVVDDSAAREGWKTVEYDGVRVDIPTAWERVDMGDCEFQAERWAPPDAPPCDSEEGVAFYRSATYDPADGPGVRRAGESGGPAWGGYAYAGDFAVYASDGDRAVVRDVLVSAREAG